MKTRMKEDNKARLYLADVIYCTGATLTRTRLDKGVLESSGRERTIHSWHLTQASVHCDTATSYYKWLEPNYTKLDTIGSNTSVQTNYKQDSPTTGANRNTAPLWALLSGPANANLTCSRSGLVVSQHTKQIAHHKLTHAQLNQYYHR